MIVVGYKDESSTGRVIGERRDTGRNREIGCECID